MASPPAGARLQPAVLVPAASRSNSLIAYSNSAYSLIQAKHLPVTANSFPCSAAQGIWSQTIETARALRAIDWRFVKIRC
jgi:hypothetical protein